MQANQASSPKQASAQLQRGLRNRHIQLIAMGGAIGTGLFLGSAQVISSAGPSIILAYAIAGLVAFLMMRQLGEMIVHEPVAGSFSYFSGRYWHPFAGFLAGWNYWLLYVLAAMTELTAIGLYVQYWWPFIPSWLTVLLCFIGITLLNFSHVKVYGEAEFWMAIIKVAAVVGMIIFGLSVLLSAAPDSNSKLSNLWQYGGFFPNGLTGMVSMLAFVMFAFGGIELIAMAAAEAKQPQHSIPKAINQVVWRILLFYVGSLAILLSLIPWNQLNLGGLNNSPFVLIFSELGITWAAHLLNFIILTAALSVYNSAMYANSRMLFGMAEQGHAPKQLKQLSAKGVPVFAVMLSASAIFAGVILNYVVPEKALGYLVYVVVAALVLNWTLISLTHLYFKRTLRNLAQQTLFPAVAYPLSNFLVLGFMGVVLWIMWQHPTFNIAVKLLPCWIALMWLMFKLLMRQKAK